MSELEFNTQVRLEIYRQFIERGRRPAKTDIAGALRCPLPEITAAYSELANKHMLVLQPETGEVLMANPLSAVPTPFLVETRGNRSLYGNCIWDALGIISMLRSDGRVLTSCGCCGEQMTVAVSNKEPVAQPGGLAHFALPARRWWDDIVFN